MRSRSVGLIGVEEVKADDYVVESSRRIKEKYPKRARVQGQVCGVTSGAALHVGRLCGHSSLKRMARGFKIGFLRSGVWYSLRYRAPGEGVDMVNSLEFKDGKR